MTCRLEQFEDGNSFADAISEFLEERESENALFLGTLAALRQGSTASKPFMTRAVIKGKTAFAAIYHEINVIVSRGPDEASDEAAVKLSGQGTEVPGVVGPAQEAERFATVYAKERRCAPFLAADQRIYELTELRSLSPAHGRMRLILPEDRGLIAEWAFGFDTEALPHEEHSREHARQRIDRRIHDGTLFGWEVEGRLVSMAGLARPTRRTISVNSVYTPPLERRRGFATALVAELSAEGLRRGKQKCVLYTDLSNPTSNSIYMNIGYRPVCDSRNYRFRPLASDLDTEGLIPRPS